MNGKKVYTPHEMKMRGLRGARSAAHIKKMNRPDIFEILEKEKKKKKREEERIQRDLQNKYLYVNPKPPKKIKREDQYFPGNPGGLLF